MATFWRLQGSDQFESGPSWDSWVRIRPSHLERPADPEGWSGYWWVTDPRDRQSRLVKAEDVPVILQAGDRGKDIDVFVPGLYGCDTPEGLADYIIRQVGGVGDGDWVAVYEGVEIDHAEDGVVFKPSRLLRVLPAQEFLDWY